MHCAGLLACCVYNGIGVVVDRFGGERYIYVSSSRVLSVTWCSWGAWNMIITE